MNTENLNKSLRKTTVSFQDLSKALRKVKNSKKSYKPRTAKQHALHISNRVASKTY